MVSLMLEFQIVNPIYSTISGSGRAQDRTRSSNDTSQIPDRTWIGQIEQSVVHGWLTTVELGAF